MPVRRTKEFLGSLAFRLLALLSLALMPIGAIAVYQTSQMAQQVREIAEAALLADAREAVQQEKGVIERAFGAAEIAGALTLETLGDTEECSRRLAEFVSRTELYVYAAVMPRSGIMECSSADRVLDASNSPTLPGRFEKGSSFANASDSGAISGQSVLIIGQPVVIDGSLSHFILLSLPRSRFNARHATDPAPLSVVTFSAAGDVLSDNLDENALRGALPEGIEPTPPETPRGTVYQARNQNGEERVFSVVPVHGGVVYAISSWPVERLGVSQAATRYAPWLFPVVMWLATLLVTYIAINLLVVRHVRSLGRRMRRFARSRLTGDQSELAGIPAEFAEMNENFLNMAHSILRDEAELENALREKTMLLREVHHRVKNNLQLIASIMNMQMRRSRSPETSEVVRRLQDRVLGLATVHRQMYRSESLSDVPVHELLDDILTQTLKPLETQGVPVTKSFQPLALIPDQAVPLALLLAEAAANTLSSLQDGGHEHPFVSAALEQIEDGRYRLTLENSLPLRPADQDPDMDVEPTGLGAQLIRAFSAQIGGEVITSRSGDRYRFAVEFLPKHDTNFGTSITGVA